MVALVSVGQARDRLRIDEAYAEDDLLRMTVEATDIVLDYIKKADAEWTEETVPPRVQTAILLVMRNIYDGVAPPLSEPVKNLVYRLRDPALA